MKDEIEKQEELNNLFDAVVKWEKQYEKVSEAMIRPKDYRMYKDGEEDSEEEDLVQSLQERLHRSLIEVVEVRDVLYALKSIYDKKVLK